MRRLTTAAVLLTSLVAFGACGTSEAPVETPTASTTPTGPVTVTDARGKQVTLDGPARRVGGTEWNVAEYASSLGVDPVAVSDVKGFTTWDSAVTLPADVIDLGTRGEPSTDTVASAGLDVLFVTDQLTGNALQQIEKNTPVVVVRGGDAKDPLGTMWDNIDLVAQVTGTQDRAAQLKQEYEAKVAETKTVVTAAKLPPVAYSDAYVAAGQVSIRPYGEGSLIGGVMKEAGLTNAWSSVPGLKYDDAYGLTQTDVEGLTKLPAETSFWYVGNDDDGGDPFTTQLAKNKIWTSLPFVESGDVHRMPDAIWMFGGPKSMIQFLDAVQTVAQDKG